MTMTGNAPSKLRFLRYGFMTSHAILLIAILVLSVLGTGSVGLLVVHCAAAIATIIYLPAAIFIALRGKETRFDHAGGEIAYLSVQAASWTASCIIAGITGGPGICHTALFSSGRLANSFPGYHLEIAKIAKLCKSLKAVTSLSVIHTVVILSWIALDVYLVYSASSSSSMTKSEGFRLSMWRLVRGEYKQVGQVDMGESRYGNPVMATPVKPSAGSVYGYGRTAQYSETRSPVNPFGSSYEVDDAGPFDNPFDRTPTKQSLRR